MQKITIPLPLFTITLEADNEREIIKQAAFWLSIPGRCPICEKPLILDYATPQSYQYYKLKCTGPTPHAVNLGEKRETHDLYYDPRKAWEVFRLGQVDAADQDLNAAAGVAGSGVTAGENLPARKNELIGLIMRCKDAGIRTGITPGDVGPMTIETVLGSIEALTATLTEGGGR